MRYLLDSHTFIWLDSEPEQLSDTSHRLIADPEHTFLLSLVSVWEMQIKADLGRLTLRVPVEQIVQDQCDQNAIEILGIRLEHIYALSQLPDYHKDPFDRLIIAQAMVEGVQIITKDSQIARYAVETIW